MKVDSDVLWGAGMGFVLACFGVFLLGAAYHIAFGCS